MTLWHQHLKPTFRISLQKVFLITEPWNFSLPPFKHKSLFLLLLQVSLKIDQVKKWSEPHIETVNSVSFCSYGKLIYFHSLDIDIWVFSPLTLQKLIPSIKDAFVTLTIYLEPKVHYLTDQSIEVLYMSKQTLTPYLLQGFDVSYYYLEVTNIFQWFHVF